MTEPYNIAARAQAAFDASGLTMTEAATGAGMSWAQLYKILKGRRPHVSADTVRRLATALGCTSDYLLGLKDEDSELVAPAAS